MKSFEMPFLLDSFAGLAVCWSDEPPLDVLKKNSLIWDLKCGLRSEMKPLIEGDIS